METGKTGKYFKYAIGEIVLVVIGILIALSINNWNTDRVDKNRVNSALRSIKDDIIKDTLRINEFIRNANIEFKHNEKIRTRALAVDAKLDTLVQIAKYEFSYYWISHFEYTNDSYESMKSSGLIEKVPDSIKILLIDFHESQNYWIKTVESTNAQYRERFDEFIKTYSPSEGSEKQYTYINNINWTNIDPRHFNPRFYTLINAKYILWSNYLQELNAMQKKSHVILNYLNEYLNDYFFFAKSVNI